MKNGFCLKRACVVVSAVAFLTAGIPGLSTVTAWALPSTATVATSGVNVRSSAVDGDVIGVLSMDMEVDVTDSTTGSDGMLWYQVRYTANGVEIEGWVRSDLVYAEDDSEAEEQAAAEEAERAAAEEAAAREAEEQAAAEEAARQAAAAAEEAVATSEGGITYVISSTIPASVIPDGFRKTNVNYEGNEIQALVMETADVYLLYMEDAAGMADGRFVIYDMDRAELIPYICFDTQDGFVLLLNIPDSELSGVSDRFSLTTCEFDTGTMDALQMIQKDSVISDSVALSNFYYMYGVTDDGTYGWYVYDRNTDSIQENILSMRYNLNGTTVEVEEEEEPVFSLDSLSLIVIVGILVILLLLVILVIIFGIRYRQLAKEYDALVNEKNRRDEKKSGGRRGKKSKAEKEAEDEFYFDEEDGDDSVFSRKSSDADFAAEQMSRPLMSEDARRYVSDAADERTVSGIPATEPLRGAQQAEPVQPVTKVQQAEPVQPVTKVQQAEPVPVIDDDDDDDLEFL